MTENELKIELMCYKEYVNPNCDLDNMSKEELEEFYKLYVQSETYISNVNNSVAKVIEVDVDKEQMSKRDVAHYKL